MMAGMSAYDDDDEDDVEVGVERNISYGGNREVHYSDIVGSAIRDAVTGARYPWIVGSFDERRFYKVRSTTAYANQKAKGVQDSVGRSARQGFYESPYSYMNHYGVILDEGLVKSWYDKTNALYPGKYIYPGSNGLENS
jgi:hypothetical protein